KANAGGKPAGARPATPPTRTSGEGVSAAGRTTPRTAPPSSGSRKGASGEAAGDGGMSAGLRLALIVVVGLIAAALAFLFIVRGIAWPPRLALAGAAGLKTLTSAAGGRTRRAGGSRGRKPSARPRPIAPAAGAAAAAQPRAPEREVETVFVGPGPAPAV